MQTLCWFRQHQQIYHFPSLLLLSDSRFFLTTLSSPPSFLSLQSLWQIWQELTFLGTVSPPVLSGYNGSGTLVSPGNNAARRGALVAPSAITCSLFPLISRIHLSLFSQTGVLPRHSRCVPPRLRCNKHSLLLSFYFFRIGRFENLSCSAFGHSSQDTFHLILHCPATDYLRRSLFDDSLSLSLSLSLSPSLSLFTISGPGLGELRCFWGSMVFRHAPIPRNGSDNNNNNNKRQENLTST